jgi:hypothetical protein
VVKVGADLLVGAVQVVEDGVRAVEALAGEALLPEEGAVRAAGGDVVLGRDLAELHAVDHGVGLTDGEGLRPAVAERLQGEGNEGGRHATDILHRPVSAARGHPGVGDAWGVAGQGNCLRSPSGCGSNQAQFMMSGVDPAVLLLPLDTHESRKA